MYLSPHCIKFICQIMRLRLNRLYLAGDAKPLELHYLQVIYLMVSVVELVEVISKLTSSLSVHNLDLPIESAEISNLTWTLGQCLA